jgi:hypothetical protein
MTIVSPDGKNIRYQMDDEKKRNKWAQCICRIEVRVFIEVITSARHSIEVTTSIRCVMKVITSTIFAIEVTTSIGCSYRSYNFDKIDYQS